jgi:uncharacterized membrane protein YeaQ/YmgE (transglycosylase-associated protein family)/uncharacterized protein YjbJ (UPF0337 family)
MGNFIVRLIAGAVLGGLVTLAIHRRHSILLLNIVLGGLGALVAGYLLSPLFHIDTTSFSWLGLLAALGGTIVLLAVVNFFIREHTVSNADIAAKWGKVRNKIHSRWNKITEEDIEKIDGNHDEFIDVIQERYGMDKEKAEEQLQGFLEAVTGK